MPINNDIIAAAEAILFACGSPVEADRLTEILEITTEELNAICEVLTERYEDSAYGITLVKLDDSFQLCTKPFVAEKVKKALELRKAPPLSKAALEVLAIIAYNQPVTRSFIEMVRGVDSSYIISGLADKGLVASCGCLDAPGKPLLYATTDNFLRCFGLESLEELPEMFFDDGQISLDINKLAKDEQDTD